MIIITIALAEDQEGQALLDLVSGMGLSYSKIKVRSEADTRHVGYRRSSDARTPVEDRPLGQRLMRAMKVGAMTLPEARELAINLGYKGNTADRYLSELAAAGLVYKYGRRKDRRYKLVTLAGDKVVPITRNSDV